MIVLTVESSEKDILILPGMCCMTITRMVWFLRSLVLSANRFAPIKLMIVNLFNPSLEYLVITSSKFRFPPNIQPPRHEYVLYWRGKGYR